MNDTYVKHDESLLQSLPRFTYWPLQPSHHPTVNNLRSPYGPLQRLIKGKKSGPWLPQGPLSYDFSSQLQPVTGTYGAGRVVENR